jgi:hypothetical protein
MRIAFALMRFHEFHVCGQADPETRDGCDNRPWPAQILTHGIASKQTYTAQHMDLLLR